MTKLNCNCFNTARNLALFVIGLVMFGCNGGGGGNDTKIRFVHASPDSSTLDFYIDSTNKTALAFGSASDYISVDEGTHRIQVNPGEASNSLIDFTSLFADDSRYSVLAGNNLANVEPILVLDNSDLPDFDNFRIRAVNAAASIGSVDVYVLSPGEALAGHDANFSNIAFRGASNFDQIDQDDSVISITATGTLNVLATSATIDFDSRDVWTLFILEKAGGGSPPTLTLVKDRDG